MMEKVFRSVALIAIMGFGTTAVKADFINVIGYTSDIIYLNAHYVPDGPITASIFFDAQPGQNSVGGASINVSIHGESHTFRFIDDGYGRASVGSDSFQITSTYFAGSYRTFVDASSSSGLMPLFKGVSYRLQPADFGFFVASEQYFDDETNTYIDGLEISFRPTSVSLNGISEVPLPPAAPLFGAALLALSGIGYARSRGSRDTLD